MYPHATIEIGSHLGLYSPFRVPEKDGKTKCKKRVGTNVRENFGHCDPGGRPFGLLSSRSALPTRSSFRPPALQSYNQGEMRRQRQQRTLHALRAEVYRLHSEGKSFSEIGEELNFSKQRAHQLWKMGSPSSEASNIASRKSSTSLTVRQRRFAAGVAQGKTQRQAALDAGCSPGGADDFAQRAMKNPDFQQAFEEILDRHGLSDEEIARVHAENLRATKVVGTATKDGKITDFLERPDFPTRQKAARDGWELRGRIGSDQHAGNTGAVHIYLTLEQKQAIEAITGVPLPVVPEEECRISQDAKRRVIDIEAAAGD